MQYWKAKRKWLMAVLAGTVSLAAVATAMNTPSALDRQLDKFGGAKHPATITELLDAVEHHPENVIALHRHLSFGGSFAERIALEGKEKSIWTRSSKMDDEELVKAVLAANKALDAAHKPIISMPIDPLLNDNGEAVGFPPIGWRLWLPKLIDFSILAAFGAGAWWFYKKKLAKSGMFAKSPAKLLSELPGDALTLDQIEGIDEIKEEIEDWIKDIKDSQELKTLGGKPAKAKLLVGPSGTGKTAIARAIALACSKDGVKIPFLYMSGGEFLKKFVGTGSESVSLVFDDAEAARDACPLRICFVCIDEIDALLGMRSSGEDQGAKEADRTVNQFLVEMDGMGRNLDGIIFVGMTNRPDRMDPAAMRPGGRFGDKIEVPAPDRYGRERILAVYGKKLPLGPDVDLAEVAAVLPGGTTGATISDMMLVKAPLAARKLDRKAGKPSKFIGQEALLAVADEIKFGAPISEARASRRSDRFKRAVRKHEVGHLIAALALHAMSNDVTVWGHIVKMISGMGPSGMGGFVMTGMDEDAMALLSETELRAVMIMAFGGTIAEELYNGGKTVGNGMDIELIDKAATQMVTRFDMAPAAAELTALYVPSRGGSKYLGGEGLPSYEGLSGATLDRVAMAKHILKRDAKAKCRALIQLYKGFFDYFHPLLAEAPGQRFRTKEIYEHWNDFNRDNPAAKPDWLVNPKLWSAYWDCRNPAPPTLEDFAAFEEAACKFPALASPDLA